MKSFRLLVLVLLGVLGAVCLLDLYINSLYDGSKEMQYAGLSNFLLVTVTFFCIYEKNRIYTLISAAPALMLFMQVLHLIWTEDIMSYTYSAVIIVITLIYITLDLVHQRKLVKL